MEEEEDESLFVSEKEDNHDDSTTKRQKNKEPKIKKEPLEEGDDEVKLIDSIYINDDKDDPVIQEFPIVFNSQLPSMENVFLFQYPTRSSTYPYVNESNSGILEARIKPQSGMVEVDVPVETNQFYDEEKTEKWQKVESQTMGGVLKECKGHSNYMVGIFKNGELHVTPFKSVALLRPQFKYIDKIVQVQKDVNRALNAEARPREAKVVQMSAKSSAELAPKYSGALVLKRMSEEEEFIHYEWYDRDTDESWAVADKLLSLEKTNLISSTTHQEYSNTILKSVHT